MNKTSFIFLVISILSGGCFIAQNSTMHSKNQTYAYAELIETYQAIASKSKYAQFSEFGKSDIGKPIHLVVIAKNGDFSPEKARKNRKSILLINNGIHAGEACGIDASVELVNKLTDPKHEFHGMLDSVVVLIIPVYNVGGMLNRGSFSRANQNGPEEHGFRGNAKNLDLNRDFIKLDSRNAKTFTKLFRAWDPDIFIDTHTTNGSDHQYTLTLINTQKDKLNPVLSQYAEQNMVPAFYQAMENKSMNIIPYVSNYKSSPDQGIKAFLETPRYSSGYTALFDCFSFITEAHVYKSFTQRVQHTLAFLETVITYSAENATALQKKRREAKEYTERQSKYTLEWELDTMTLEKISFSGYESVIRESELTEQEMMFYNREEPFSRKVPYYNSFKTKIQIEKPKFYIVPQAYERVIDRLLLNDVRIRVMEIDSLVSVYVYYIKDYVSPKTPYEGHFLHTNIEVEKRLQQVQLYKGDYWIEVNQESNRYIVETLEPQSVDGFFAWNFFDGIVQQKEWFSDYSFEPKAIQFLKDNPQVKEEFENKKATDRVFANNSWAQLYYIYKKSPYYEKTVNRYPVYRIE